MLVFVFNSRSIPGGACDPLLKSPTSPRSRDILPHQAKIGLGGEPRHRRDRKVRLLNTDCQESSEETQSRKARSRSDPLPMLSAFHPTAQKPGHAVGPGLESSGRGDRCDPLHDLSALGRFGSAGIGLGRNRGEGYLGITKIAGAERWQAQLSGDPEREK